MRSVEIMSSCISFFSFSQVKQDEFQEISRKSESAANVFWMISNSKKCPNCRSPIEKNEGCNHMRCSRVRGNSSILNLRVSPCLSGPPDPLTIPYDIDDIDMK